MLLTGMTYSLTVHTLKNKMKQQSAPVCTLPIPDRVISRASGTLPSASETRNESRSFIIHSFIHALNTYLLRASCGPNGPSSAKWQGHRGEDHKVLILQQVTASRRDLHISIYISLPHRTCYKIKCKREVGTNHQSPNNPQGQLLIKPSFQAWKKKRKEPFTGSLQHSVTQFLETKPVRLIRE